MSYQANFKKYCSGNKSIVRQCLGNGVVNSRSRWWVCSDARTYLHQTLSEVWNRVTGLSFRFVYQVTENTSDATPMVTNVWTGLSNTKAPFPIPIQNKSGTVATYTGEIPLYLAIRMGGQVATGIGVTITDVNSGIATVSGFSTLSSANIGQWLWLCDHSTNFISPRGNLGPFQIQSVSGTPQTQNWIWDGTLGALTLPSWLTFTCASTRTAQTSATSIVVNIGTNIPVGNMW